MCLSEDLYATMVEVGHCARRHKIPGPLADAMISVAQNSIDLWRSDEKEVMSFARKVLSGPFNLRATTGLLPEPVRTACWRLITLLESLAGYYDR